MGIARGGFHGRLWGSFCRRQVRDGLTVGVDVADTPVGRVVAPGLGGEGLAGVCGHGRGTWCVLVFVGPERQGLAVGHSRICNVVVGGRDAIPAEGLAVLGVEGCGGGGMVGLVVPGLCRV